MEQRVTRCCTTQLLVFSVGFAFAPPSPPRDRKFAERKNKDDEFKGCSCGGCRVEETLPPLAPVFTIAEKQFLGNAKRCPLGMQTPMTSPWQDARSWSCTIDVFRLAARHQATV
eukprot:511247-Amphidinium_carterae.2